jgi:CBS domain-containing protein
MSTRRPTPAAMPLSALTETPDRDPHVRPLMSRTLVAIVPSAPLIVALRLMIAHGIRHLPVVEDGHCLGLIAEVDLLRGLAACRGPFGSAALQVAEVVRAAPRLSAQGRVSDAAHLMHRFGVDAVLVDDEGGLVGIVTASDMIRALICDDRAAGHLVGDG